MKIEIWRSFASNNSGSYTLVGSMRSAEDARALVQLLEPVLGAQTAWSEAHRWAAADAPVPVAPLAELLRSEGIEAEDRIGGGDAWPDVDVSAAPAVIAIGPQVLVHAPWTITMPRELGMLVFARGGRVSTELDHAHHTLLLRGELWMSEGWKAKEESAARLDALVRAVDEGALAEEPTRTWERAWPPALYRDGRWGTLEIVLAPLDLVAAARRLEALARAHRLELAVSVVESEVRGNGDPLAHLRAAPEE